LAKEIDAMNVLLAQRIALGLIATLVRFGLNRMKLRRGSILDQIRAIKKRLLLTLNQTVAAWSGSLAAANNLQVAAGPRQRAFTLIELLVVIAIIAILASLLLPALERSKQQVQGVKCLSNTKQLDLAWIMYAFDNNSFLPPNQDGEVGSDDNPTWCTGWLAWPDTVPNDPDNTNYHRLIDNLQPYGFSPSLGPYLAGSYQVFSCPSDVYDCQENGVPYARVRSLSMNGYIVGGGVLFKGRMDAPPTPCDLNSSLCGWLTYQKMSDIIMPSPSALFVTLDEHPDSINDAWFIVDVSTTGTWADLPASYHNGAGGFSFADGHSEIHKWLRPATRQPVRRIWINGTVNDTPGNVDISWMTNHCSYAE
jgi:prepilin-type N-terminal cleavage/methylation domain-containing protein/prepilin-type processing-associated H-X9-DG protein